jgi:hypothetical protein
MSRNFTPDETLIDRLLLDDTSAFEELHHRYCYPLYSYCLSKLNSTIDSKRIVRDIFVELWENRRSLPVGFSISLHLYTEVRKAVVKCVNKKLIDNAEVMRIELEVIPEFKISELQKAMQPVKNTDTELKHAYPVMRQYDASWWDKYQSHLKLKGIKHAFQNMLNLF